MFDNKDGRFTPGLYARIKLVGSETYPAALIKDEAIGTDLGKKFVLVLGEDNKVAYRAIELGPKLEGLRIVRHGLAKGEKIVINGLQRAMPGAPVEPEAVPMADEATLDQLARLRQSVEERDAPRLAEQNTSKPSAGPRG
ncbi:efflux transporter, RND family, MFP subunit [compost metagenome]